MIEPSTAQAVYNDMGALADLRGRARANPNEAVEEVAQQFEALFIQMMLKSMRDAVEDGGLFGSDQLNTYEQMSDQQLALDMASKGGIGLAEALVAQLSRQQGVELPMAMRRSREYHGFSLTPEQAVPVAREIAPREQAAMTIYREAAQGLNLSPVSPTPLERDVLTSE